MIPALLLACAANIAPVTLETVIRVESRGNPLALNVNQLSGPQPHPRDADAAARLAAAYVRQGYSVDIGLMQINSRNLAALGVTIEQVLEPCENVRAGGTILTANYAGAVQHYGEGQPALKAALSAYNTGNFYRGFENGYVARYYGPCGVPALTGSIRQAARVVAASIQRPMPQRSFSMNANPYTAGTRIDWPTYTMHLN
jgi:type IV secretion system protein VirB1